MHPSEADFKETDQGRDHPEPVKKEKKLPVMEIFGPTIQGEGSMIGIRTTFIRFGLCDYKCVMCDSMHAVDPIRVKANATWMTQFELIEAYFNQFQDGSHNWVTLSGGNPAMHNLDMLIAAMHNNGIDVAVETQGTLCPNWMTNVDCLTVSPKSPGMGEKFEQDKFQVFLDEFGEDQGLNIKVVVFSQQDIEFAKHINELAKASGHYNRMYLSLGNPYPPGLDFNRSDDEIKLDLLKQYRILAEDILQDKSMYNVKFLPQLHVLTWANRQKV